MIRYLYILLLLAAVMLSALPGHTQAYCYIREVKVGVLSNGVQLQIRADGILTYGWLRGQWGENGEAALRFPSARLGLDTTLYDVNQEPVSTATLTVPQDAKDGRGVDLTVVMTQPSRVEATLSEDRQTFLLTVYGKRTVERPPSGLIPTALSEGAYSVTADSGRVTVRAVKANIHEVVAEIARLGNLNVAIDDGVRRSITLAIRDRSAADVLRAIAAGYGLAVSESGDVFMVSEGVPTELSAYRHSGTASFPMTYLKASDAKSLLPTFLFKYVHDNPEQNAVVVTAPAQMLDKIGRDLKAIDAPPPMILVECAVVEITDGNDLDSGFRWSYKSPEHSFGADAGTGVVGGRELSLANALATAISPTPKLQAWLQALTTRGRAEVRAHPSMAAVNGKTAEIFIGSQRFIKMTYVKNGQNQDKLETVPVGVRLQVRPWTGGNSEITTWIDVEVSNIVAMDPQTGIPRLSTRNASTTMRTVDGDTIVIGGLTLMQDEKTTRRIPLLGDLPLIGSLFRSSATRTSAAEMAILIRPRLLDAGGHLPSEEELRIRGEFALPPETRKP